MIATILSIMFRCLAFARPPSQFPSLFGGDNQFLQRQVNFTTNYEQYGDELAQNGVVVNDEAVYGGGDIAWTLRLRERYRQIMAEYHRSGDIAGPPPPQFRS